MRRAALLIGLLAAAGCGGDNGDEATPAGGTGETRTTLTESANPSASCGPVAPPAPRKEPPKRTKPKQTLPTGKTYQVTLETNCGSFTIELTPRTAPNAAASFVALARSGYYDGTTFHRIVPGFVIQGGDPTGSGTGGPGYTTVDRPAADTTYTRGTVAMAKAGNEPPGTAGSQFFVVTAGDAQLPPDYAVIGRIVDGANVVGRIARLGDPVSEEPTQAVAILDMKVSTTGGRGRGH